MKSFSVCFISMYYRYSLQVLAELAAHNGVSDISDDQILKWANEKVVPHFYFYSSRDLYFVDFQEERKTSFIPSLNHLRTYTHTYVHILCIYIHSCMQLYAFVDFPL